MLNSWVCYPVLQTQYAYTSDLYVLTTSDLLEQTSVMVYASFTWVIADTFYPSLHTLSFNLHSQNHFQMTLYYPTQSASWFTCPMSVGKCHDIFSLSHLTHLFHSGKAIAIILSWYKICKEGWCSCVSLLKVVGFTLLIDGTVSKRKFQGYIISVLLSLLIVCRILIHTVQSWTISTSEGN